MSYGRSGLLTHPQCIMDKNQQAVPLARFDTIKDIDAYYFDAKLDFKDHMHEKMAVKS